MSYIRTVNFEPTSCRHLIATFLNHTQSCGWTVVKWSNATTISTGGSPAFTAADFPSGSWAIIQQKSGGAAPVSGTRQLLFWNRGGDAQWNINYSQSGAYGSSGQNATTPPTASDEQATPDSNSYYARSAYFNLFDSSYLPSSTSYVVQMGGYDTDPRLWMFAYAKGAGNASSNTGKFFWVLDVMESNSYPFDSNTPTNAGTGDKDPILFSSRYQLSSSTFNNPYANARSAYRAFGLAGQSWTDPGVVYQRGSVNVGYHHNTGKADLLPIMFGGSNSVFKGVSSIAKYVSKDLNSLTLLDGASEDRIVFGDCAFPWDLTDNAPTP